MLLETLILSTNCYIWKRETWRRGPAIKQYLSSISISQGNSNEVTNVIFTTEYLTGRLWARASVISISFASIFLLTNSFAACVVQLQTSPFFLALFWLSWYPKFELQEEQLQSQRIAQHVQSFYVIACMKRLLSIPLWPMNRNVFIEKRHSARVPYSLSMICLLQVKCNTRKVTDYYTICCNRNLYIAMYACAELFCVLTNVSNKFVFRRFPLRGGSSPLIPPDYSNHLIYKKNSYHAKI